MQNHDDVFIGGRWVPSRSTDRTEVINPATEEVWASVPDGNELDINDAVLAARSAFPAWAATSPGERAAFLRRLADEVDVRAAELSRIITTENGTPIAESGAAPSHSAAHLRLTADLAEVLAAPDRRANPMAPGHSVVRRVPVGVAGLITPWNFPLGLIIIKLGPALLAGCTVVIKPAPETPMATRLLMDAVAAAGIPDGVVNLVTGSTEAGSALITHRDVDKISFTGSTTVGRAIARICGDRLRPVTLELGGKSPAIVLDDFDPEIFAKNLLKVSMRNTGQTCKACTRLLVPVDRQDEIASLAGEIVGSARVGDPFDPETFFGPVVSARQRDRIAGYLSVAHTQGAKAVTGGDVSTRFERGYYIEPTVFSHVTPEMTIAREEIFGPVLSVIGYRDIDDAVAIANDSDYGLAATVFSADEDRATSVAERLHTGNIGINHYGSNAAAPFGGHKDSGLGTEFGAEGLDAYLQFTSIHYPS
ncbi:MULTISPECIES: aldehyde dehydrogenase [unclassified Rhodococcus (in: high G+C Gram-positive bacteria)]|uniref:aldehyde dehydrogenase n=1 Tax=unclassified Rhodococcus (in: high G+C Gram-positive bacteria) TaxID=192944 RepID=UPI0016396C33|nr:MULTISPECIES: aldehyde dehydrogenase [unclassified Rhodococcus (in: high G+C Gram-positive bacteria)]MBC2637609.1 aldehyde dehydrogenase [Rhodococcus sp. 3A]MBC2897647.1 aldehyde dehydrogenase [Rhodococcus sp. 4CII]